MKKVSVSIPDYNPSKGIQYTWEDGFEVQTELDDDSIVIKANKEGLKSLAYQLLTLAELPEDKKSHLHYDEHNSLEEGYIELIIDRI